MGGLAPLSHAEVGAWARLMDVEPEPHEVEALMILDAAIREPDPGGGEAEQEMEDRMAEDVAWPTRKTAA